MNWPPGASSAAGFGEQPAPVVQMLDHLEGDDQVEAMRPATGSAPQSASHESQIRRRICGARVGDAHRRERRCRGHRAAVLASSAEP